jgi:putative glutamine amidotransferase
MDCFFAGLPPFCPDATISHSMTRVAPQAERAYRPRVGVPWRMTAEERAGERTKLEYYFTALRRAGAQPVDVSLQQTPERLGQLIEQLDGFVLPGSPADVDPGSYGEPRHIKTKDLDENRDKTDEAILEHAFRASKPVLAICYGCQILNVYLKGTLVQDIPAQRPGSLVHGHTDLAAGEKRPDALHQAILEPGSRLAVLSELAVPMINSSHHQAIDRPGENLRVTARATDGIIEGVEWTGDANWVVGVQWHPERMVGDPFAEHLFGDFIGAVSSARAVATQES